MSTDVVNEQASGEAVTAHQSPGELLQAAREKAGLTEAEVADRLKIPESYVSDIEHCVFDKLPGLVFVRGYVRSYAKLVSLDADKAVEAFDRFTGDEGGKTVPLKEGGPIEIRRQVSPLLSWGGTLAVILAVGVASFYGWNSGQKRIEVEPEMTFELQDNPAVSSKENIPVEAEAELPLEEAVESAVRLDELEVDEDIMALDEEADQELVGQDRPQVSDFSEEEELSSVAAVTSGVRLVIRFVEDCWVQVKDMDGNSIFADIQRAGTELDLEVPAAVEVRFGNVPGVGRLNFDGKTVEVKPVSPGRKVASLVLGSLDAG